MPQKKNKPIALKLGDRVLIRDSTAMTGRIVELRGALGPKGAQIYRVRLRRKPKAIYVEVREDQLEPVTADENPSP